MKVLLAILADYANMTREGKLNVMGLFDTINASNFPARHLEMQLIVRFQCERSELDRKQELEIKLQGPHGEEIAKISGQISVGAKQPLKAGDRIHVDHILRLNEIIFPSAGLFQFAIFINGDLKDTVDLHLMQTAGSAA